MKLKTIRWIVGGMIGMFLLLVLAVTFSIVPTPTEHNTVTVTGILDRVYEGGGEADIVFRLRNDENYYYINRGLEQGIDLHQLQEDLTNNEVGLTYVDHISVLDPMNSSRHLSKVEYKGEEIFNEMIE